MIGAIIGDIVGSRFEFNNHRNKVFTLFTDDCEVTDDSIITLAIAKATMETEKIGGSDHPNEYYSRLEKMSISYMQQIGRKYPNCGFGNMFGQWVFSNHPKPYNSFGNGAAMRISPVGFATRTMSEAIRLSKTVTETTHNHEEGVKGAEATAVAIFMARQGFTKSEIRHEMTKNYYSLHFTIDEIRESYEFNETCQETVPQAIVAFLESTSFEDAIRTAISVGGDSDTLAAITGAMAEAYYGVPMTLRVKALTYLDHELRMIYDEWCDFYKNTYTSEKFKVLTKYIGKFSNIDSFGEWMINHENDRTPKQPMQMPFVIYNELVDLFIEEFYQFSENFPEYQLTSYRSILENNGLKWADKAIRNADSTSLDEQCILALIMGSIRADRFGEGIFLRFLEEGIILNWLIKLESFDH